MCKKNKGMFARHASGCPNVTLHVFGSSMAKGGGPHLFRNDQTMKLMLCLFV